MSATPVTIVYDGDCPFCSTYVRIVRLKEAVGEVRLLNAREDDHPFVRRLEEEGYDLDEGMALIMNGDIYYGADVINRIALMSSSSTLFNKLNRWIFASPQRARLLYPLMRAGRNLALKLLGRRKLSEARASG